MSAPCRSPGFPGFWLNPCSAGQGTSKQSDVHRQLDENRKRPLNWRTYRTRPGTMQQTNFSFCTELLRIPASKMEDSARKRFTIPLWNFMHSTRN
jgi:hypothetical protein